MVSILAYGPSCPGLIPSIPGKIFDVAEVNKWHWLEERGQWLENVDRTHLHSHSCTYLSQLSVFSIAKLSISPKTLKIVLNS